MSQRTPGTLGSTLTLGTADGRLVIADPTTPATAIGATGSAKTTAVVIPSILEWHVSVISTSVKADVLEATGGAIPLVLVRILTQYLKDIRPQLPKSKYLLANHYSQANGSHIGKVAPRAVHHIVNRIGNTSDVGGDHFPHRWRHHYATGLIKAGVSLEHVRKLMGHASITTTARYIHLDNNDLATAVNNTFPGPHSQHAA